MLCSSSPSSVSLFLLLISLSFFSSVANTTTTTNDHSTNHVQPQFTIKTVNLQANQMVQTEKETLFKIMETISSDANWRISYPNPCKPGSSWYGIECKLGQDNKFHVSRLAFGTSPNPKCKPTSIFPSLIFELPHLQSLFLFNCFTHTETTLSVSQNRVLRNSTLQQLSLRSNPSLVGPIPPLISSISSLQVLTLSQNRISGPIPVEIFRLNSLVHLDLSYNLLNGIIPYQIGNLKNLIGLDLSYNLLTGSIPSTIGQLDQLQKLDISSNSIMGTIPNSIENLNSLNFIALSNNKFQGKVPNELGKLQNLQYFIMDDNPMFITLPLQFGKLVKLQELRLANSGYSGSIPSTFSNILNLSTLSLQNNQITGKIPISLSNLSHIYHLNLSRNLLGGVIPFNTSFLNRLGRNLDLSGNPGLCLSQHEATNVSIGVKVCAGNISTGSLSSPLKKSDAPFIISQSLFVFVALSVLGFEYLIL